MDVRQEAYVTMEELLEESAESEELDKVLDRLQLVAEEWLPNGWRNWKVVNWSKEEVFGKEMDPQVLNKVRFALPTVAIAKAFNPTAQDLPEKVYRDYKVEMLNMAFCRALIMSPPAVVNKIKGSAAQAEIFLHALKPLKEHFISRKQAADLLRGEEESEDEEDRVRDGKRKASSSEGPVSKRSKFSILEERMENMFQVLLDKIEGKRMPEDSSDSDSEESEDLEEPEGFGRTGRTGSGQAFGKI